MPTHSVKQGDTLLSIAAEHKFRDWETIWNHEQNRALREKRPDPQVLAEGDQVFIPEKKTREVLIETDQTHTFTVKSLKAWFRTVVRDDQGRPLGNCRYQLEVDGKQRSGYTDESGVIELRVDPRPAAGKLTVFIDDDPGRPLTWNLRLGHLDPIDKLTGVKARLTNLGFLCGAIDEQMNDETRAALQNFQIVHRLPLTGEADGPTRARLYALHDKR